MNNTEHTQNIIEQLSQLRDLLIVIERGGSSAPDVLYKLAIEKSQQITSLVEAWRVDAKPQPVQIPAEYEQWLDTEDVEEQLVEEADNDTIEPVVDDIEIEPTPEEPKSENREADMSDEDNDFVAPFVEDEPASVELSYGIDMLPEIVTEEESVEQVDCVEDIAVESEGNDVANINVVASPIQDNETIDEEAEPAEVFFATDDITIMEEDIAVVEDGADEEDVEDTEDFDEEDEYATDIYNRGEPMENEPITVGEMMSMRQAKELRKAISLNDRFRFRRELFGNNDVVMNDTLNLIDTMNDYQEACDYLLQDLGWSADEIVVQEFFQLLERHFRQR